MLERAKTLVPMYVGNPPERPSGHAWRVLAAVCALICFGSLDDSTGAAHSRSRMATVAARPQNVVVPLQVVQRTHGKTYTLILVPVLVNGHGPYPFLFDTGCPVVIIASDLAAHAGVRTKLTGATAMAFGTSEHVAVGIATISVGGATVQYLPVSVQNFSSYRTSMDNHYDGIIGYNYMSHFGVTLDFVHRHIILRKPH